MGWTVSGTNQTSANVRERPPGLINHVLTVVVFLSWVLAVPPPPELIQPSICFHGLSSKVLDLLPPASLHLCKNGTHSTCFYSTRGHTPKMGPVYETNHPAPQTKQLFSAKSHRKFSSLSLSRRGFIHTGIDVLRGGVGGWLCLLVPKKLLIRTFFSLPKIPS